MDQHCTYRIKVRGHIEEADLNASSPVQVTVLGTEGGSMQLSAHADQSGLLGLIRHLHVLGLAIQSVNREQ
jgi:hypothetical protein